MNEAAMGDVVAPPISEALVIRPGDKLLVRVDVRTSRDLVAELKAQLEGRLPGVEVIIIGAEQMAVFRG